MVNAILEAIAVNSVFSLDEVKRVYEIYKSFDLLVKACVYSQKHGSINLERACSAICSVDDLAYPDGVEIDAKFMKED